MKRVLIGFCAFAAIAGVAYLSVIGCCSLISHHRGSAERAFSMSRRLKLSGDERRQVDRLEKEFLVKKENTCRSLCAKRERLAQLLRQEPEDQAALSQIVEEIGRDQMILEKATLDHLRAIQSYLNPEQRRTMNGWVAKEMESACEMTACGYTPGCVEPGHKENQ